MTKRVTVSLPDDIADLLEQLPPRQVSSYVAEAVRRRQASESMREILRAAGHREFEHDPEGARTRIEAGRVPPDVVEAAKRRLRAEGLWP